MTSTDLIRPPPRPARGPSPGIADLARRWLRSPRGLVILAILIVAGGIAAGWGWLVALGIAPLILSVAPCLAMCALGGCMMAKGASSCAAPGTQRPGELAAAAADAAPRGEER